MIPSGDEDARRTGMLRHGWWQWETGTTTLESYSAGSATSEQV